MATIEKTVELIFAGIDQTSGVVGGITKSLTTLEGAAASVAKPIAKIADAVLTADAALLALAGGGLIVAFNKAKDFETAMVDLAKILGDQPDQLRLAASAADDLALTYGKSSVEIVNSFGNFKQAGFSLADAMNLSEQAIHLVIAGQVDMDSATRILVQTLKGFNAPASDANRIIDTLNITSQEYATNVEQLADAMARSAPIAKLTGFSYEELAGVLTPMIEVFQNGEIAGRAFNTILQRMQDDSKPVRDALDQLGVSQFDLNGELRSAKDIFYDVVDAFGNVDDATKTFIASQLAGKDQAAKLSAALTDQNKIFAVTQTALESTDSQLQEVEKRLGSTQAAVDRFGAAYEILAKTIGLTFLDAAKQAIDGATSIETVLVDLVRSGAFDDLLSLIENGLNRLGDFLSDIAKALPSALAGVDFTPITDALGAFGDAIAGFFGDLDLTKSEDLTKAIQFAVDTIASLITTTQGMAQAFAPLVQQVLAIIDRFNDLPDTIKTDIGDKLLGSAKLIDEFGAKLTLVSKIMGTAETAADGFQTALGAGGIIYNTVTGNVDGLRSAIGEYGEGLRSLIGITDDVDGGTQSFSQGLELLSSHSQTTGQSIDALFQSSHQLAGAQTDLAGTLPNTAAGMADVGTQAAAATGQMANFVQNSDAIGQSLNQIQGNTTAAANGIAAVGQESGDASTNLHGFALTADGVWTNLGQVEKALPGVSSNLANMGKETNQATEDTEDFRIKIHELDNDIRSTQLQLAVDLQVAQFEADTDRITSAFQSITDVAGQTGDQITTLFNQLAGAMGSGNIQLVNQIQAQIQKEEARRQQEFTLQRQLVQAQIDSLNIRNQILQQGGGLIQIDSSGLEPALEMVMWNIIEKVQVRVNASAAEFLLGVT